ncbi:hypothetical protein AvCA_35070 [Azotobacter vinelandii CA]|uniref:Transmembrane protein n=2 Tax=Azotobacter vinelandii TaxID=354 RepID=C1DQM0_AZOVD|nr:hypothetical protein [Azotobacter vinelandii]ACO79656.1 conserved hypothetical protein [Azotobacter vinelandii DJ]AGK16276.1 hypothetical protein AvCA_35070 [Azotobacter vinelandii CA]AGK21393.1 hypothetical protein AvCA6_35070 [Azotobacter vinelandii CA6]WKN20517.1 hypothetical protein AVAEIV_003502 [Azotobacter vinelandii]SFX24333.1 hypothetical protein SAMN04244547_00850 [Azotobacter vinelandii]
MSSRLPLMLLLLFLPLWLAASYGVRFALMEDGQWVGLCVEQAQRWECQLRSGLGLMIHFRLLAWGALAVAVAGFLLPGRAGWRLALAGLCLGVPALVLYTASLAVFAVVIAGLRLVRR